MPREGVPASRPAWERGLDAEGKAARESAARLFEECCAHVLPAGFSVPENRAWLVCLKLAEILKVRSWE